MSLTRKFAAAISLAFVATLGFGATATAANADNDGVVSDSWYDDDSLINVSDNNVGPLQACNNNVPTNVLGGQVPVSDLAGALGFSNDGNVASTVKDCDQESFQDN